MCYDCTQIVRFILKSLNREFILSVTIDKITSGKLYSCTQLFKLFWKSLNKEIIVRARHQFSFKVSGLSISFNFSFIFAYFNNFV